MGMNDIELYAEAYFKRQLSDTEMKQFEERCMQDAAFARQVALFISTAEGIRQQLLEEKKRQWRTISTGEATTTVAPVRKLAIRKWIVYAAAACVLVAVTLIFTFRSSSPQQLADEYIAQHYAYLSQTMNISSDSLQQGIAAYNNKDYDRALQLFKKVYQSNPANSKAKKYTGLVYLRTQQYDKALQQFEELANTPGLHENSGLFLMAVTLLERNKQGDKVRAKELLQQVVQQKTEGSKEAAKWLKEWE
jgi:tetratricopeptide (TPR) repeat protein